MENINIKFLDKLDENQQAQEINSIEEINNPEPVIEITPTPITGTSQELKPKNTVRYIDGNFPF